MWNWEKQDAQEARAHDCGSWYEKTRDTKTDKPLENNLIDRNSPGNRVQSDVNHAQEPELRDVHEREHLERVSTMKTSKLRWHCRD